MAKWIEFKTIGQSGKEEAKPSMVNVDQIISINAPWNKPSQAVLHFSMASGHNLVVPYAVDVVMQMIRDEGA